MILNFYPLRPGPKRAFSRRIQIIRIYISDHPLNEYKDIFHQLNIISYNEFYNNDMSEGLIAGTIMSIQEKSKRNSLCNSRFSDKKWIWIISFAEILVSNRDKLKESESFVITLPKDKVTGEETKKELMLEKLSLSQVVNEPLKKVTIELVEKF